MQPPTNYRSRRPFWTMLSTLLTPFGAALGLWLAVAAPTAPSAYAVDHNVTVSRLTPISTARRGNTSGAQYNLTCPEGRVLIGVQARQGSLVDSVRGICRPITNTGTWTGSNFTTGRAGGSGGSETIRMCPTNFALSGFSGRSGTYIDRLVLECTRLGSNGTLNTNQRMLLPAIGGGGGSSFSLTRCHNRPARAISGTASTFLRSFEFACESNSPVMTTNQITNALNGATNIVRTDSGAADVACDTRMRRAGRVRIEPSNGMWNISSLSEMNRAWRS